MTFGNTYGAGEPSSKPDVHPKLMHRPFTMRTCFLTLSFAIQVLGHSHVDEIWAPSPAVHFNGWNPNAWDTTPYANDTPGWVNQPIYQTLSTTLTVLVHQAKGWNAIIPHQCRHLRHNLQQCLIARKHNGISRCWRNSARSLVVSGELSYNDKQNKG
jgi:hypothetical protein